MTFHPSPSPSPSSEDLHKELAEAIDDRDAARAQIDILTNQSRDQAAEEMKRLQRELDQSEAQVEQLEKDARAVDREHQAAQSEKDSTIRDLRDQLRAAASESRESENASAELQAAKEEIRGLTRDVARLEKLNRDLEDAAMRAPPSREVSPRSQPAPEPIRPPQREEESLSPRTKRERGKGDMDARVEAMMKQSQV